MLVHKHTRKAATLKCAIHFISIVFSGRIAVRRTVKRISRFSCAFVCVARIDGWHKDKHTHNGTDSKQELHKIPLYFAENPCFFHRFSNKIQKKNYEINLFYCLHEKYRIRFVNICIWKKELWQLNWEMKTCSNPYENAMPCLCTFFLFLRVKLNKPQARRNAY